MKHLVVTVFLLCVTMQAVARCNNPENWLESPNEGVKVFVGYRHDRPNELLSRITGDRPEKLYFGFPPPLPQSMLDKPWEGKLIETETTGRDAKERYVSFFEPDGKGQWRLCREEVWSLKRTKGWWGKPLEFSPKEISDYTVSEDVHKSNPALVPWLTTHYSNLAEIFLYDSKGRLVENFIAAKTESKSVERFPPECWRYDDKNRITLQLKANGTKVCPSGEPDPRDDYYYRVFYSFDEPDGTPTYIASWVEQNYGNQSGSWTKDISFSKLIDPQNPNPKQRYQGGNARADAKRGLVRILGGYRLGERENSIGPSFKYASGGIPPIEYLFVNNNAPVSYEMLKDPENIYKYNRRRDTDITKVTRLHEYFSANRIHTKDRFFAAFGRILRHEQLDDEGKLKRAINVGRFSRNDGEFGFYDEDLKKAKISLKLKGHELYYRVWDYDANGRATLVALGWGARLRLREPEKIDEAKILFGLPDGTIRWKSEEEFFQAFDFDPTGERAFVHARAAN